MSKSAEHVSANLEINSAIKSYIIVRYKGDYLNGIKQGKGIFWWTTGPHAGERYEGDFMHDRSAAVI